MAYQAATSAGQPIEVRSVMLTQTLVAAWWPVPAIEQHLCAMRCARGLVLQVRPRGAWPRPRWVQGVPAPPERLPSGRPAAYHGFCLNVYHEDSHALPRHGINIANCLSAERTSVMGGVSEAARVAAASPGFKQMSGFASVAATYRKRELKPYCLVCPVLSARAECMLAPSFY